MTNHIAPVLGCNLGCTYCYEEPSREMTEKKVNEEYDIEKVLAKVDDWAERFPDTPIGLHGGEPLLIPKPHLRRIYERIEEHWAPEHTPHIQTNATLMDDEHIEIFKEYNVSVGVSCDGPRELNDERKARQGGEDVTRRMTKETHDSINKLIEEDVPVGVIVVLHEINCGTDERLEILLDWMDTLCEKGVMGHYNPAIPYEDIQDSISITPERLKEVYLRTWEWMQEPGQDHRSWDPCRRFQNNLLGFGTENCVQNRCDVYNTAAARVINGEGESTGCGKGWDEGDGVPFLQGESTDEGWNETEERYEMLKQVPGECPHDKTGEVPEEDLGGQHGCRYWIITNAGCPGAGQNDDYRNRSLWHKADHALYERIEEDMRQMFPGIKLITDLPWDAPIQKAASRGELDLKPFSNIRKTPQGDSGVKSGSSEHDPWDAVPEEDQSFDYIVEEYTERYGEENVTVDRENRSVHGDTT